MKYREYERLGTIFPLFRASYCTVPFPAAYHPPAQYLGISDGQTIPSTSDILIPTQSLFHPAPPTKLLHRCDVEAIPVHYCQLSPRPCFRYSLRRCILKSGHEPGHFIAARLPPTTCASVDILLLTASQSHLPFARAASLPGRSPPGVATRPLDFASLVLGNDRLVRPGRWLSLLAQQPRLG